MWLELLPQVTLSLRRNLFFFRGVATAAPGALRGAAAAPLRREREAPQPPRSTLEDGVLKPWRCQGVPVVRGRHGVCAKEHAGLLAVLHRQDVVSPWLRAPPAACVRRGSGAGGRLLLLLAAFHWLSI
eukprot:COSAG01_NODE_6503_length_3629_cov_17.985269_9_plen_128_part_00